MLKNLMNICLFTPKYAKEPEEFMFFTLKYCKVCKLTPLSQLGEKSVDRMKTT